MGNSEKESKEWLIEDITPVESDTVWKDLPRAMLIKAALQEIADAGAGEAGLTLHTEISRLTDELTKKEAAITVLMGENEKLKSDLRVEKEHRERLSYMMAEARK